MEYEQKELIHDYVNLDKRIKRIEKRLEQICIEFKAQNFSGRTAFTSLGVKHISFKVDNKVSEYVDLICTCEKVIAKIKRREYHFKRYLTTLDKHTQISLKRRFRYIGDVEGIQELGHDKEVLYEILEIEEAISYEFNDPLQDEVNRDYIDIAEQELTNDTLEQSFDRITELLGV